MSVPASSPLLWELRQQSVDIAVFIARHSDHSAPGHGAACDGGQDADTAPERPHPAPAQRSVAALRSAGGGEGVQLPPGEERPVNRTTGRALAGQRTDGGKWTCGPLLSSGER